MNAEHINPFVQGAQGTLVSISGENPQLGAISINKPPFSMRKVSIFVDIFGDIKAHVVYSLSHEDACWMASKMMMGMPVTALDAMSSSSLSELGNMVSGNVATRFSGKGVLVDISTPRFWVDVPPTEFAFVPQGKAMIRVPLQFSGGAVFELNIYVEA